MIAMHASFPLSTDLDCLELSPLCGYNIDGQGYHSLDIRLTEIILYTSLLAPYSIPKFHNNLMY